MAVGCESCPLQGRPRVPSLIRGGKILVVGEAPGGEEATAGRPFVGRAGKELRRLLPMVEYADLANSVNCHPPKNKLPQTAIKYCRPHIQALLSKYSEIILLGASAFKSVFPDKEFSEYKGSSFEEGGKLYHVLTHPAAMLHNPDLRRTVELQYSLVQDHGNSLSPLEPKFASEKPAGDQLIVDCEWSPEGEILVGMWTLEGVYQYEDRSQS